MFWTFIVLGIVMWLLQGLLNIYQLKKFNKEYGTTFIFISHDLGVISEISDYVIVMNKGKIVSQGKKDEVFKETKDEFTKMLIEKKLVVMNRYKEIMKGGKNAVRG